MVFICPLATRFFIGFHYCIGYALANWVSYLLWLRKPEIDFIYFLANANFSWISWFKWLTQIFHRFHGRFGYAFLLWVSPFRWLRKRSMDFIIVLATQFHSGLHMQRGYALLRWFPSSIWLRTYPLDFIYDVATQYRITTYFADTDTRFVCISATQFHSGLHMQRGYANPFGVTRSRWTFRITQSHSKINNILI